MPTDTAKFDLTWSVYRGPDGLGRQTLRLEVEYSTDLFEPATIEALAGHWQTLLGEVAASPDTSVSQLGLIAGRRAPVTGAVVRARLLRRRAGSAAADHHR